MEVSFGSGIVRLLRLQTPFVYWFKSILARFSFAL